MQLRKGRRDVRTDAAKAKVTRAGGPFNGSAGDSPEPGTLEAYAEAVLDGAPQAFEILIGVCYGAALAIHAKEARAASWNAPVHGEAMADVAARIASGVLRGQKHRRTALGGQRKPPPRSQTNARRARSRSRRTRRAAARVSGARARSPDPPAAPPGGDDGPTGRLARGGGRLPRVES